MSAPAEARCTALDQRLTSPSRPTSTTIAISHCVRRVRVQVVDRAETGVSAPIPVFVPGGAGSKVERESE